MFAVIVNLRLRTHLWNGCEPNSRAYEWSQSQRDVNRLKGAHTLCNDSVARAMVTPNPVEGDHRRLIGQFDGLMGCPSRLVRAGGARHGSGRYASDTS